MDWRECNDKEFVKRVKIDVNLINSLLETSKEKVESNKKLELEEITASTKVSIVYDALREVLEALAIKKGFKIYNHQCFCAFLNEICKENLFSFDFDKYRKIRNQINYYGKRISVKDAKLIIREILLFRERLIKKYFKKKKI